MTISSALNSALSGLQAFGKKTEVISSNIANATTPGYGKREVVLASNALAAGVSIVEVSRLADPVIVAGRRAAEAQYSGSNLVAQFQADLMSAIGSPEDARSLTAKLSAFEASLIEAASSPDAPARLERVANSAMDLVTSINDVAQSISDARSAADQSIGRQVDRLNTVLKEVESLNTQIVAAQARGVETASLFDQRQLLIDEVNVMVPVTEVARPNGQIALFTEGGVILLDGPPAEIDFTPVNTVTPYQTLAGGTLSGLAVNGVAVDSGEFGPLRGGTLAAQFAVRDEVAPEAQSQLDSVARDIISRFQDPGLDPTLAPGDAGLFTDTGVPFDPVDELGIANRITVNALVDPFQGGEAWRLRSGLGAIAPGPVGDASLLQAMSGALDESRPTASGDFGPGARTSAGLMSDLSSWAGIENATAERRLSFLSASFNEMKQAELSSGIDTDAELQNLIIVENAYAANARVLQTVDEMMEVLLRIG